MMVMLFDQEYAVNPYAAAEQADMPVTAFQKILNQSV